MCGSKFWVWTRNFTVTFSPAGRTIVRWASSICTLRGISTSLRKCRASRICDVAGAATIGSIAKKRTGTSSLNAQPSRPWSATCVNDCASARVWASWVTTSMRCGDIPCVLAPFRLSCTAEMSRSWNSGTFSSTHSASVSS